MIIPFECRALLLAFAIATPAAAEAQSRAYGGATVGVVATSSQLGTLDSNAISVGGVIGVRATPVFSIEGAVDVGMPTTLTPFFSRFGEFDVDHRDIIMSGLIRWYVPHEGPIGLEPVAGASLIASLNQTHEVGCIGPGDECSLNMGPENAWDWAFAFGADVPVNAGAHVVVSPSVRVRLTASGFISDFHGGGFGFRESNVLLWFGVAVMSRAR